MYGVWSRRDVTVEDLEQSDILGKSQNDLRGSASICSVLN